MCQNVVDYVVNVVVVVVVVAVVVVVVVVVAVAVVVAVICLLRGSVLPSVSQSVRRLFFSVSHFIHTL